jgi:quercetin dioxygenase-like cupin family protein
MLKSRFVLLTVAFLLVLSISLAFAQSTGPVVFTNDSGKWIDCPGMPAGCQMFRLFGDPGQAGEFGVRFKYVANYRIGPHIHAVDEHATVISGGPFHVAVGDNFDAAAPSGQTMHTGDMVVVPAGTHHYAWAEGTTILQVNGVGPFKRDFLNPANNSSGVAK